MNKLVWALLAIVVTLLAGFFINPSFAQTQETAIGYDAYFLDGPYQDQTPEGGLLPNTNIGINYYFILSVGDSCAGSDNELYTAVWRMDAINQWVANGQGDAFYFEFNSGSSGTRHTYTFYFYCAPYDAVQADLNNNTHNEATVTSHGEYYWVQLSYETVAGPPQLEDPPPAINGGATLHNPLERWGADGVRGLITQLVTVLAGIAGFIAILFIVINGFRLLVAVSEEARVSAKQGLTWAVGGFIVALLAFTLVSGLANLVEFTPPGPDSGIVSPIFPDETNLITVLNRLLINFLGLIGAVALIMIVYYGYRYVTSAGNEESIQQAKAGLKWSIVSMVIIMLAFTIISSVQRFFTG